jgi:hypothetical protein
MRELTRADSKHYLLVIGRRWMASKGMTGSVSEVCALPEVLATPPLLPSV